MMRLNRWSVLSILSMLLNNWMICFSYVYESLIVVCGRAEGDDVTRLKEQTFNVAFGPYLFRP